MAWYYYSGKGVASIPVRPGLSVAVRPKSKIEILDATPEVHAMIRKGMLRLTGRPAGAASLADRAVTPEVTAEMIKIGPMGASVTEHPMVTKAEDVKFETPEVAASAPVEEAPAEETEETPEFEVPGENADGSEEAEKEIEKVEVLPDNETRSFEARRKRR